MTFTAKVKEELSKEPLNEMENRNLLLGFLYINSVTDGDKITVALENASVARKLFKTLKYCYRVEINITVRTQKKFRMKQIFIMEIIDKPHTLIDELSELV